MKNEEFDREVVTQIFFGGWEMRIGKRKVWLKSNPIRDEEEESLEY